MLVERQECLRRERGQGEPRWLGAAEAASACPALFVARLPLLKTRNRRRDPRGASDAPGGCVVALFYWVGPETVKSLRLESFLPSAVQTAPSALQSVVTGRTTVTPASALGVMVISHPMLLPGVSRRALATVPPVTVKA